MNPPDTPVIGYYVHHQGLGHRQRALSISRHLDPPPTLLSSLEDPGQVDNWIYLPVDNLSMPADHTANGTLHWVPRHDRGLRRRMAIIADWIDEADPDLMVIDVSVEVALLCRLMGVPTVVMAMPGDRTDRAHQSAYDSAHAILAPWSAEFAGPQWTGRWRAKTLFAGAISRFADRPRPPADQHDGPTRVLVLWGAGGRGRPIDAMAAAARVTPGFEWRIAGVGTAAGVPVWDLLSWADVVVTHAGLGAVAEVAAARRPAVVIAEDRPHGEQVATVRTLRRAGLAVALDTFPQPPEWPDLLAAAQDIGGEQWARWAPPDAALRAAQFLHRTAHEVRLDVSEPVA